MDVGKERGRVNVPYGGAKAFVDLKSSRSANSNA
jgi:hypothetical protein